MTGRGLALVGVGIFVAVLIVEAIREVVRARRHEREQRRRAGTAAAASLEKRASAHRSERDIAEVRRRIAVLRAQLPRRDHDEDTSRK